LGVERKGRQVTGEQNRADHHGRIGKKNLRTDFRRVVFEDIDNCTRFSGNGAFLGMDKNN